MPDRKKALIAGATGVAGRNLLRHLLTLDHWDVIAVSRRKPDVEGGYDVRFAPKNGHGSA
jgi:uncharacterized protein YbjT (DUF2867 family)